MNNNKKMLLVDGNFLLFQSFYASYHPNIPVLTSPQGITTNGVHVFLMTLKKLIDFIEPEYLFVAFDAKGKTKRHEEYKDYKAGRSKAPEIIFEQFALIKDILSKMNIAWFEQVGDEADDLIATLAKSNILDNYIFSKDKDLLQLVDQNINIVQIKKTGNYNEWTILDANNFYKEYGIYPNQIPDFKGLAGDTSDNLKGVPGIGEKGAIKMLAQYGSFEDIYINIDDFKGKTKEKLVAGYEEGLMCKKLAQLNLNVNMNLNIEAYKYNINIEKTKEVLSEYHLFTALEKFLNQKSE